MVFSTLFFIKIVINGPAALHSQWCYKGLYHPVGSDSLLLCLQCNGNILEQHIRPARD